MSKIGTLAASWFEPPRRLGGFLWRLPRRWWPGGWRHWSGAPLERLVNFAGVAAGTVWFVALLLAHFKVVTQPGPQEYNEPAIWETTWLLDHGRNPFTIDELPGAAYCFGPLYNYVVIALEPLLGIDYPAHRMVALFFLLAALGVLFRVMVRAGAGAGIAVLAVVFYYRLSLANIEITARPDTMGLFFFLLGILVPWNRGYTRGATFFGLLCAVVAYLCKPYFAVAGCATLLIHFLVRDKRDACWFGVVFFGLLGAVFALMCWRYPYYYIENVVVQRGGTIVNSREDISIMHNLMLAERAWPFALMIVAGVGTWIWRRVRGADAAVEAKPALHQPTSSEFVALAAVFMIFLALVYYYMGWNAGAFFTYHLHLLLPLMMVLAAYAVNGRWRRIVFGGLMIGFCAAWVSPPEVSDSTVPYRRMEQLVREAQGEVLGIASQTDIFERYGRPVLHDGNTMFIGFAFMNDAALKDKKIGALDVKFRALDETAQAKIKARAYVMVFSEFDDPYFCPAEVLRQNYDKIEQIDYFTYFGHSPVRVWVPKPRTPEPAAETPAK